MASHLSRATFSTSRLLDFFTVEELTTQTGHPQDEWPLVIAKELIDNSLDAAEEFGVAPVIDIVVDRHGIEIADNGPGLPPDTVKAILDYSIRVSSRAAYVSPTRGAQGNALKTILAMPFVLDRDAGCGVEIVSKGVRHVISCRIDLIRQEPVIDRREEAAFVKSGASIRVAWPDSASSILELAEARFLQIAEDFAWLNPHLTLTVDWFGVRCRIEASNPAWTKWKASDPTSAHWYSAQQFERLVAAYNKHDQDRGSNRLVRQFIAEFRGLSGSAKQKAVLDATGLAREPLSRLADDQGLNTDLVRGLHGAMQLHSKPVKASELGIIGADHLRGRFEARGCEMELFQYRKTLLDDPRQPVIVETAFAWAPHMRHRRLIVGVNWSAAIINPFRQLAGVSLDSILTDQEAGEIEPVCVAVHIAMPRASYTDRGKSAVSIDANTGIKIAETVKSVTKSWAKQRKAEERNASARRRRRDAMIRVAKISIKEAAAQVMKAAYLHASARGTLPAHARQVMYAARPYILELTGKETLDDAYFTQTLLPDYIKHNPQECRDWNVVYDARGNLIEPHTDRRLPLGTLDVRGYLTQSKGFAVPAAVFDVREGRYPTHGPRHRYGDILYIEKEGFLPLFNAARLAERYDIAIMSNKGMSVTSTRELVDELCSRHSARLLVLHDFDRAGFSIRSTLERDTRQFNFKNAPNVIDLGMRIEDIAGLESEAVAIDPKSKDAACRNLIENGATPEEIDFLLERRVELNAFASNDFIAWIEQKLVAHGVRKVVPDDATLAHAYERAYRAAKVQKLVDDMLAAESEAAPIVVPPDLRGVIEKQLGDHRVRTWDSVVMEHAEAAVRCGGA